MKRIEVLQYASPGASGKIRFREVLAGVKDFDLSLQVVINGKRIKEAADVINETIKDLEPEAIKAERAALEKAKESERENMQKAFNRAYNEFWGSPKMQEFLKGEADDLKLKKVSLKAKNMKQLGVSTPDEMEALMIFTDIETLKVK